MIKHIVFWRLNGENAERRKAQAQEIKTVLEALNGRIDGLRKLEIGIDFSDTPSSAHVVLYSELDSREALAAYQTHPEHVKAVAVVKAAASERQLVDYEI